MLIGIIVGSIVLVLLIAIICVYNALVGRRNTVEEAFSTMDVYLKKRWDLVPNLVEVVKQYAKHEEDTFTQITALRTGNYDEMLTYTKININEQLTEGISKVMAVAENYPELKASENFLNLSAELTKIEDEIANSRKYYNGTVRNLNNKIQMFPSNIIATIFKFEQANMFEANIEERNNVKVSL